MLKVYDVVPQMAIRTKRAKSERMVVVGVEKARRKQLALSPAATGNTQPRPGGSSPSLEISGGQWKQGNSRFCFKKYERNGREWTTCSVAAQR
jgi:hypothetical protein